MFFKAIKNFFAQSALSTRLAKGAIWSLLGTSVFRGIQLLSSIVIARVLGKVGFGEFSIVQNTIMVFGTLAGFGLGMTATKFIAEFKTYDLTRTGKIIYLTNLVSYVSSGIASLALFILAPWLAKNTLGAPHLTMAIELCSVYLFLIGINGAQNGILAGFETFKIIARLNLISGVVSFPIILLFVNYFKLYGAIYSLIVSSFLSCILFSWAIKKVCRKFDIPAKTENIYEEIIILKKFTIPSVLSSMMVGPVMWVSNTILVNQANGYGDMGIYNAIYRIKQIPEMLITMVLSPILPMLSEYYAKNNTENFKNTIRYSFVISLVIIMPISLLQFAVPQLTLWPFGKDYHGKEIVVQALMLHSVLQSIFFPIGNIVASLNRMWLGWIFNIAYAVLHLSLSFLLIPKYGALGLALALIISYYFTSIISIIIISKYNGPFIPYRKQIPILIIVLLIIVFVFFCYVLKVY